MLKEQTSLGLSWAVCFEVENTRASVPYLHAVEFRLAVLHQHWREYRTSEVDTGRPLA